TGLVLAGAAILITVGVGSAIALGVLAGYDRASHSPFIRNIGAYILPVICGLLASTSVSLLHACAVIGGHADVPPAATIAGTLLRALAVPLVRRIRALPDLVFIVAFGALSLAVLLALSAA